MNAQSDTGWYYMRQNQPVGPIGRSDVARLVSQKEIQPGTLVWTEGMAEWSPASSSPIWPAPATSSWELEKLLLRLALYRVELWKLALAVLILLLLIGPNWSAFVESQWRKRHSYLGEEEMAAIRELEKQKQSEKMRQLMDAFGGQAERTDSSK